MAKRIEYIDVVKGIGIILMIIGHIISNIGIANLIIHSFHMPIFFIVSGYLYKKSDELKIGNQIRRKSFTLLIPYLTIAIFHLLVFLLINWDAGIDVIKSRAWAAFFANTSNEMPYTGVIWFLSCLFAVDISFLLLKRFIKNEKILFVVCLCISLFGTYWPKIFNFRLFWALDTAMTALGFYYIGYVMGKYSGKNKIVDSFLNMKGIVCVILLIAVMPLVIKNGHVNMRLIRYNNEFLFWVNAIIMSLIVWNFSKIFTNYAQKNNLLGFISKRLQYVGRNSIIYMGFNQIAIFIMELIFIRLNVKIPELMEYVCTYVVVMFALLAASQIITKSFFKVLFGMKYERKSNAARYAANN